MSPPNIRCPNERQKCSSLREQSCIDGVINHDRSWSELTQDILHLFSKKLSNISDFIRFRAVCKSWQLSAPVNDPPPQLPWLLQDRQDMKNAITRFYCLSSGKVHTITCPSFQHACLWSPGSRYLFASYCGNSGRYLLNPLTNDQIHVPVVCVDGWSPGYIGPNLIEGGDIVVISGCSIIGMQRNTSPSFMAFWRPEADEWVFVEGIRPFPNGNAFYMGQYFSNDFLTGITNVIDISSKKLVYEVAPPEGKYPLLNGTTIMVESGGKILRLFQHDEAKQCHFDIYCLCFGDGEPKSFWMKITEIGDQMLFLQNYQGLSFCASNFAGFKGNCIYFVKNYEYLCRYDIGDGTTEVLPCPFDSVGSWFVPSLV